MQLLSPKLGSSIRQPYEKLSEAKSSQRRYAGGLCESLGLNSPHTACRCHVGWGVGRMLAQRYELDAMMLVALKSHDAANFPNDEGCNVSTYQVSCEEASHGLFRSSGHQSHHLIGLTWDSRHCSNGGRSGFAGGPGPIPPSTSLTHLPPNPRCRAPCQTLLVSASANCRFSCVNLRYSFLPPSSFVPSLTPFPVHQLALRQLFIGALPRRT